ncbi:zymogen granule membrane protein 16-like [Thamnophis elegans]|uniref:zymogen granule membrane protein 16-like n=1 Tax=Thamnophis elegans TaxID=35005 RepID=UPI001378B3C2|nr:zymogen granule membrane protein 16-like [Thamnophis elegans]
MLFFVFLSLLCAGVSTASDQRTFPSYSGEYGGNDGDYFDQSSNQFEGPISAMKIRSNDRNILSIQVRYGDTWSNNEGSTTGRPSDMHLFFGEGLVQVNGRFGNAVEYLAFRTNMGHVFTFGSNSGLGMPFTAEPSHPNTVLRFISGKSGSMVNALGFHWGENQWMKGWNESVHSPDPPPVTQI